MSVLDARRSRLLGSGSEALDETFRMSTERDPDGIDVRDRASRRRFIRTGAALLVGGAAAASGRHALAADCDRYGMRQQRNCSDSDSGENADPDGCGRCGRPESVPSSFRRERESSELMVGVTRVRATRRG